MFCSTLSSLNTEPDNSLIERAISLVKRNPRRAAILTARKMRAVKPVLTIKDAVIELTRHHYASQRIDKINMKARKKKKKTQNMNRYSPQSSTKERFAGITVRIYINLHEMRIEQINST